MSNIEDDDSDAPEEFTFHQVYYSLSRKFEEHNSQKFNNVWIHWYMQALQQDEEIRKVQQQSKARFSLFLCLCLSIHFNF